MIYGIDYNLIRLTELVKHIKENNTSYALLGDYKSADVVIVNNVKEYNEFAFFHNKHNCLYKNVLCLLHRNQLDLIKDIHIVNDISALKLSEGEPSALKIVIAKDTIIDTIIDTILKPTEFSKILLSLTSLAKDKVTKRDILRAFATDIKNLILKQNTITYKINNHKDSLSITLYNRITKWLQSEEAKQVCVTMFNINDKTKSFEINYLLHLINN